MSLYRYYFFDKADRLKGGDCVECFNAKAAIAESSLLLIMKEPAVVTVEIWQEEQFIGGERRDGASYVTTRTSDSSLRTYPIFSLDQKAF